MDRMEPPRLPEDRYRMTAPTLGGFAGAAAILMAAAVIVGSARHVLPESVAILLFLTAQGAGENRWGWWFPAVVFVTGGPLGTIVGDLVLRKKLP